MNILPELQGSKVRLNEINQEKVSSTWFSTLPIKEERYSLSKHELWDLVKIYYGSPIYWLPNTCSFGTKNNIQHSLICGKGGFISYSNMAAGLLVHICHNVRDESPLQTLTREAPNITDETKLNFSTLSEIFGQNTRWHFLKQVFLTQTSREIKKKRLQQCFKANETKKKKQHNELLPGSHSVKICTVNAAS